MIGLLVTITLALAPLKPAAIQDCADCPAMIRIAAGSFLMGSPTDEPLREDDEGPRHEVRIAKPFAIGAAEVTHAQYAVFVKATGHESPGPCFFNRTGDWRDWVSAEEVQWDRLPTPPRADDPVVCVSFADASAYAAWLSKRTGRAYRLPSEAEWEYAARAGTKTPFAFGRRLTTALANYHGGLADETGAPGPFRGVLPVARLRPNAWGLYDMHGNVWEWTADCSTPNYTAAPPESCDARMTRGGTFLSRPFVLRSAARTGFGAAMKSFAGGFRVAADAPLR